MATKPSISVIFKQYAASLIARSQRGIAALILRDTTEGGAAYKLYGNIAEAEADSELYTAANMQYIRDVFAGAPYRLAVVRATSATGAIAAACAVVAQNLRYAWITIADGAAADFTALVTWIKAQEISGKSYKGIVYNVTAPDCRHIVNFATTSVTFSDTRATKTGDYFLPSLLGIVAGANVTRGVTNAACAALKSVTATADEAAAVTAGKLILYNDVELVRIVCGVNSLTTTDGGTATEDMQYIETVEAMDLIADDISEVFREQYLGNYRNSYDNQVLFIAAVNQYFSTLAAENILDRNYDNRADVNVTAQRAAWVGSGKSEAAEWDDATVKRNAFKRTVYLAGDIKILGSMEHLNFTVSMF